MHEGLRNELDLFERRTPGSKAALAKAWPYMPLGVASNFRSYEPYPVFIKRAHGSRVWDVDGNEIIDFNLCFGAIMAGHCHPAVVKAVQDRLENGTMLGMPFELERELAEEIIARFPVEQVRFSNSGTEATMHAIRVARGFTDREKLIKFEGCYHGVHGAVMVSVKPDPEKWGEIEAPNRVVASAGIPKGETDATLVATFNDLASVERQFEENLGEVAAVIVEPVPMNIGIVMPEPGFLEGLRALCTKHGALLIFDEVKTGAKLGRGGACEYFNIKPDMICLAKSIGGGFPLAAFGGRRDVMDVIAQGKVFHAGTYNTNCTVIAAGLAVFRQVLTPEGYAHINSMNTKLVNGCNRIIAASGLTAYSIGAGANGAVLFYKEQIRNHREWRMVDVDLWKQYWFGMVNRGVMPQPFWWDEQWTISVQHSEADIDMHLAAFADLAPALAKAQQERGMTVSYAAH